MNIFSVERKGGTSGVVVVLLMLAATAGAVDSAVDKASVSTLTTATTTRMERLGSSEPPAPANRSVNVGDSTRSDSPALPPAQAQFIATAANIVRGVDAQNFGSGLPGYSSGLFIVAATPGKLEIPHQFFDRANLIGFSMHAAVRAADAAQTCAMLGKGAHEAWLPMKSCAGITAYSLSMVPAQIASSYMLHRSGHHMLEKWMPYLWAAPSAAGIAVSVRTW